MEAHMFILYVSDQERSKNFYSGILEREPRLHVPGMTEIVLSDTSVLGLMPEKGIYRLLEERITDPAQARGVPRCELYLFSDCPKECLQRAVATGARHLSDEKARDWGHSVAYCEDPDGHILAFAKIIDE